MSTTAADIKETLLDAGARLTRGTESDAYSLGRWGFRFDRNGEWSREGDWSVRYYGVLQKTGGEEDVAELAELVRLAVGNDR